MIAENKSHAHHNTIFFDHSVVFTCFKVINAFKR